MDPKVFSYQRFSSGRQATGTSIARQTKLAQAWCSSRGLTLDESLTLADLGLSAYHGDNKTRGALGAFISAIEQGKVPKGSFLLVESLDRISRAKVIEAMNLLAQIVYAGVKVVSLNDGIIWDEESIADTSALLVSVVMFSRAHEESRIKAKRVSAAFQLKRQSGLAVVSASHGGGWVKPRDDKSGWDIVQEKADSVRRVFEYVANGYGGVKLAKLANQEKWITPWRTRKTSNQTWEHTGISRLLRDRRVLGEWQPKRMIKGKYVNDGEPVKNYFPTVIDEELWFRAQNALSGRMMPKRIRGKHTDIFSNVFYCSCGAKMQRKAPSERGNPIYYCVKRNQGLTKCMPIREEVVVDIFFTQMPQWKRDHFDVAIDKDREAVAILQAKIEELKLRLMHLVEAVESLGGSNSLLQRLTQTEQEEIKLQTQLEETRARMSSMKGYDKSFSVDVLENARYAVSHSEATEERHRLQQIVNGLVDRMSIRYFEDDPDPHLQIKIRQGDQGAIYRIPKKYQERSLQKRMKNRMEGVKSTAIQVPIKKEMTVEEISAQEYEQLGVAAGEATIYNLRWT